MTTILMAPQGAGRRRSVHHLLLGLVLVFGPTSAWACMPDFHEHEAPVRVEGEAGFVSWQYGIWEETTLGTGEDLTHGFVSQQTITGDWCGGRATVIIQDCSTGQAVSFGGEFEAMVNHGPLDIQDALRDLIRARAYDGRPMSIAEIAAEATEQGLERVVPMRTTSTIQLGDYQFQLGEACRAHYPELAGGSSE
jgi:hypothetical protein